VAEDDEVTIEDLAELLRNWCLNYFETAQKPDGAHLDVDSLYGVVDGSSRTDVREAIHTWAPDTVLEVGREGGTKVVFYRPLAPLKKRLRECHEQADENGNVSPTLIKLFMQEYVVLHSDHREEVRKLLQDDMTRSIRHNTIRRAKVCSLLSNAIIAFKVAPDEE
jgi:hypothetical protein